MYTKEIDMYKDSIDKALQKLNAEKHLFNGTPSCRVVRGNAVQRVGRFPATNVGTST